MPEIEQNELPYVPPAVEGIETNFCKNPLCGNFGAGPGEQGPPRGRPKSGQPDYPYKKSGIGKDIPGLNCKRCGETFTVKSNLAIAEELRRILSRLEARKVQLCCPNSDCVNHGYPVLMHPLRYKPFSYTTAGNPRFRCRKCGKTFTIKEQRNPIARQRKYSHLNRQIFLDIVFKMPFKCISGKYEIPMVTVYNKLDFFYRQCVAFAASREGKMKDYEFEELYISIDRQDYRLNWTSKGDRRNMVVSGVASAEKYSGYIFGHHLNFDSTVDTQQIIDDAEGISDNRNTPPFRRYARFWVPGETVPEPKGKPEEIEDDKTIITNVKRQYAETVVRADVDVPHDNMDLRKKAANGFLVHPEYTLYAHFEFLKRQLAGAKKIVFYMDQESGIRAACFSAFHQDILDKRVDAFYVKLDKELTIDEKNMLVQVSKNKLRDFIFENPELEDVVKFDVRARHMEFVVSQRIPVGPWKDEWLPHPFPDMGEPKKAACWLTDIGDRAYTDFELGKLFLRASLHPVDRYFMLVRRRTSLLERPTSSSSSGGRKWFAYDPYQPAVVEKLIEIYRVYYNYVKKGEDGQTPAMRLGFARRPIKVETILYFSEKMKDIYSL
jgi:transposase-like protein